MAETRAGRSAAQVTVAAAVNGAASYVVLVLVARSLSASDYADFLAFWGLLFLGFGMLTGVQADVTRAVARPGERPPGAPRVLPLALVATALVAVPLLAAAPAWATALVPAATASAAALALAGGVVAFAGHAAAAGALGGAHRWHQWSALVAGESTARLCAIALVAWAGGGIDGFALATGGAALTWLGFLALRPSMRAVVRARSDRSRSATLRGWCHAVVATGCSSVLVVGYPVLVRVTSSDAEYAGAAALLLALMLTRGPILLPLGALQNVLVARVSGGSARRVPISLVGVAVVGAVVACAGLGALLGPWVLRTIRPGFHVDASTFALLGVGAVLVGVLTVTGAVALARDRHGAYSLGWTVATVAAVAVLAAMPAGIDGRVIASLLLGPVLGIAVHVAGASRSGANVHAAVNEGPALNR